MTLVDKVHETFMSYMGRSPKQIYIDACQSLSIKPNHSLVSSLSNVVDDFYSMETMSFSPNYFGPKGCMAILPLVQSQQRLKSIDFAGCGADDDVVRSLFEILLDHPRLRSVVLSANPLITVCSAKFMLYICKQNRNIIDVKINGTSIGRGVRIALSKVCDANQANMEKFFPDDVFALKDMFLGLDVDGSGWVNINTFVASVSVPMVQEKLKDRIAVVKPPKREDHCINFNTFLNLVCRSFKSKEEIAKRCSSDDDAAHEVMASNWICLLSAMGASGLTCSALGKLRIRSQIISFASAQKIVGIAAESVKKKVPEGGTTEVDIPVLELFSAWKSVFSIGPKIVHHPSFFDPSPVVRWRLAPTLVKEIVSLFDKYASGGWLSATTFLSSRISSDIEFLRLDYLRGFFTKFSIPVDETRVTLEEATTIVDEFYDFVRVDKPITFDDVKAIAASTAGS